MSDRLSTDVEWEVLGEDCGIPCFYSAESERDARDVYRSWCARYPEWTVKLVRIAVVRSAEIVKERKREEPACQAIGESS